MKHSYSIKTRLIAIPLAIFIAFIGGIFAGLYLIYDNNVSSFSESQIEEASKQTLKNYETYFDNVITTCNSIQNKIENTDLESQLTQTQTKSYLDELHNLRSEIVSISIYSENGLPLVNDSYSSPLADASNEDWFISASNHQLNYMFSRIGYINKTYEFTLSKYIAHSKDVKNGVLRISFDFSKIVSQISQTNLGTGGHISIYDNDNNIVYSSNMIDEKKEAELVNQVVLGTKIVNINNVAYDMFISTISKTSWRVVIFTNYDSILSSQSSFIAVLSFSSLIVLALFIISMIVAANNITNPIKKLQEEMNRFELLDYTNKEPTRITNASREVRDLDRSFNAMSSRIHELALRVMNEKEEQRKAELKALQNQINPHFLYNTLDSIVYLIDKKENSKAQEMIIALSKFFRISISKGKNVIPIAKELEQARNYLVIQKIRYGEAFEFSFETDERLNNYYCVKLILQPVIENALVHGLKECDQGMISIRSGVRFLKSLLILPLLLASGCSAQNKRVGIYIYYSEDTFVKSLQSNIISGLEADVDYSSSYAELNQTTQNFQIVNDIDKHLNDLLIINLVDRLAANTILKKTSAAGIPAIFFNREPFKETFTNLSNCYFIGSDPQYEGELQAEIVNQLFGNPEDFANSVFDKNHDGKIQIVMMKGEQGHQDTENRSKYSILKLKEMGYDCDVIYSGYGNWERSTSSDLFSNIYASYSDSIELTLSNNDDMALGIIDYLKTLEDYNPETEIKDQYFPIIGVDATSVGVEAVNAGELYGTIKNDSAEQAKVICQLSDILLNKKDLSLFEYPLENDHFVYLKGKIIKKTI
ncbi:MAG: substrate-binding domain-containing protein [Bacilli bacterium]